MASLFCTIEHVSKLLKNLGYVLWNKSLLIFLIQGLTCQEYGKKLVKQASAGVGSEGQLAAGLDNVLLLDQGKNIH